MYTLLRILPVRNFLLTQLPPLGGSLLIAELFYKFGSFSLEVVAFLITWLALDALFRFTTALSDQLDDTFNAPLYEIRAIQQASLVDGHEPAVNSTELGNRRR